MLFRCRLDGVHLWVCDLASASKHGRLAENDVFFVSLDMFDEILHSLKPNQGDSVSAVGKFSGETQLSPFADGFHRDNLTLYLNIGVGTGYFTDGVEFASVDVSVREIIQQVLWVKHFYLTLQHLCFAWRYASAVCQFPCSVECSRQIISVIFLSFSPIL